MNYTSSIFSRNRTKPLKILIISTLLFLVLAQGQARACTLKNAQDQFTTLNELFQIYQQERTSYLSKGQEISGDLQSKQLELSTATAGIRKLFALAIERKSGMKASDPVDVEICNRYEQLMNTHAPALKIKRIITLVLPVMEPEKQKPAVCVKKNIRKRFGIAVRKQRKLTIAGKINRKEQIAYLNIASKFIKNAKSDFQLACQNLHDYEKHLASEKSDQPEG